MASPSTGNCTLAHPQIRKKKKKNSFFLPQSLTFTTTQIWMLGKENSNILADIKHHPRQNKPLLDIVDHVIVSQLLKATGQRDKTEKTSDKAHR
jgi:hypothetical protein